MADVTGIPNLGGVGDVTAAFSWINTNFITFMVFMSLGAIALILWIFLNRRYPKVMFLCWEAGPFRFMVQRLDGDKIVGSNLLMLFLQRKQLGESIQKFDRIPFEFPRLINGGVTPVYLAALVRGALVPLRLKVDSKKCAGCNKLISNDVNPQIGELVCTCVAPVPIRYIIPDEVNDGRTVALVYAEALDTVDKETKSHEPVQIALITIAMIAIPIGVFVLAVFLIQGNFVQGLEKSLDKLVVVSQNLAGTVGQNATGVV